MVALHIISDCFFNLFCRNQCLSILKQIIHWLPGEWIIFISTNPNPLFTTIWTLGEHFLSEVFINLELCVERQISVELLCCLQKFPLSDYIISCYLLLCYLVFQTWLWLMMEHMYILFSSDRLRPNMSLNLWVQLRLMLKCYSKYLMSKLLQFHPDA